MKLKLIEVGGKTYAEVDGDKPIYTDESGKDIPFDAPTTIANIGRLNGEAKAHRERAEKAEGSLKAFEGISDAEAARKALETVANIKDGELISAGKAEEIKAGAKKAAEEAIAAAQKASAEMVATLTGERDALQGQLYAEKVGGAFARSKYVAEKVAVPPPMLEKTYGGNFKIEEGKLAPYDANGTKIYSRVRPTEVADFDEAIEILIAADPYKDHILKGQVGAGGGANSGGAPGSKTMPRSQFDKLQQADPRAAAAKMKDGFTLTEG